MSKIEIKAPTDGAFSRSRSGTIWGPIYFRLENGFFPAEGWSDIVLAFLTTWLDTLLSLLCGSNGEKVARFYDGPFEVRLGASSEGCSQLSLTHRGAVEFVVEANVEGLLRNAVEVATSVLEECARREWTDDDTRFLASFIEQSKRRLRS